MAVYDTKKKYLDFRQTTARESHAFVVDFVADGLSTTGTYNAYTIPVGYALVGGSVAVKTGVTSSGSATVKFSVASSDVTAAIAKTELVQDDVLSNRVAEKSRKKPTAQTEPARR